MNGDAVHVTESPKHNKLSKKVSFAEKVTEHAARKKTAGDDAGDDSDDEDSSSEDNAIVKSPAVGGTVTLKNEDGETVEVVSDHATKSAVTLSACGLLYELDNE